ncbi:MAG: hypothetical protein COB33_000290, partial [Thiotrichaceae bacterium]|nr:hypothetical protein [Thiotrichaceae bacterium]
HLIISPESYLSFEHIGLFGMLEASMKWMPAYEIIENIREEERKIRKEAVQMADVKGERRGLRKGKKEGIGIGEERGEKKGYKKGERVGVKKGKVEMAKAMKKDKKPVEEIQKYTQLTKADIQAL